MEKGRELGLFSLQKRRLWDIFLQPFNIKRGLMRKTEKDFLPVPVVTGQRAMVINSKRVDLDLS